MAMKGYKLHKEHKDYYEMIHPNGSIFKVAKNGLSPDTHVRIKKFYNQGMVHAEDAQLASGSGEPEKKKSGKNPFANNALEQDSGPVTSSYHPPADAVWTRFPDGGRVKKPKDYNNDQFNTGLDDSGLTPENSYYSDPSINEFVTGTEPLPSKEPSVPVDHIPRSESINNPQNQTPEALEDMKARIEALKVAQSPEQPTVEMPPEQVTAQTARPITGIEPQDFTKGLKMQMAGQEKMMQGQQDYQRAVYNTKVEQERKMAEIENSFQQQYAKNREEREAQRQWLSDPKNQVKDWWSTRTEEQKSTARIALALGAAGAALAGGPNTALEIINGAIKNDLQAQEANLNTKRGILRDLVDEGRDITDARHKATQSLLNLYSVKLDQAAALSNDPIIQGRKEVTQGLIQAQLDAMDQKKAFNEVVRSTLGAGVRDTGQLSPALQRVREVDPKLAEDIEKRAVPGVGVAAIPLTDKQRDSIVARQNVIRLATELKNLVGKVEGDWFSKERSYAQSLALELQTQIRIASLMGNPQAAELEILNKTSPNDISKYFADIRTLPKLEAVIANSISSGNGLRKSVGLPLYEQFGTPYTGKDKNAKK